MTRWSCTLCLHVVDEDHRPEHKDPAGVQDSS